MTAEAEGPTSSIDGMGKPKDRAQVKLELVGELADQRHHPGVVGARRELGKDRLVAADEEFDAENAVTAQRLDHLARLEPRRMQRLARDAAPAASCRDSRPLPGGGRPARRI